MIDQNLTTILIGLGEIGKPLLNLLAKAGKMIGVDIKPVTVEERIGIMHVCYPFLTGSSFIRTTVEYVEKYKPAIVVINSTVVPGTTERIQAEAKVPCVYSPVRGKHSRMEADLLLYQKFIGGDDLNAVNQVRSHFSRAGMKTSVTGSSRVLELAKLLETTYFGLLIAWAQEMERLAKQINADYFDMTKFFEEIGYFPPVVFKPGYIGGHCVIPNIELLETVFNSEFLATIKKSNEKKAQELAGQETEKNKRIEPIKITR